MLELCLHLEQNIIHKHDYHTWSNDEPNAHVERYQILSGSDPTNSYLWNYLLTLLQLELLLSTTSR